jgi:hypothetical protein
MSFHRELDRMAVQDFGVVEESLQQLEDDAAMWSIRYLNTAELIRSACDALVAGADSPALRGLAGAFDSAASFEIEELLQRVASDFGFDFHRDTAALASWPPPVFLRGDAWRACWPLGISPG